MKPRPYQEQANNLIRESFKRGHKRIIRCAPTGSGKSIEMSLLTKQCFEKNKRVILLTHRMELFRSTLNHLGDSGIPCVELNAKSKMPTGQWQVMLAMERTLYNRIKKNPASILEPALLIADEIHFANFNKIIAHFKDSFLVGFSATPQGKHIHTIYTDIIQNIDIPELIEQRYLVPCKPYMMQDNFDDVKVDKTGEFEDKSHFAHFNKSKLYDGLIDEYRDKLIGKKTIVFCVNVEHTVATHKAFTDAGLVAYMVHSEMKLEERDSQVKAFESDPHGIMINCGILTTGYDHPPIEGVIVYRATTSLPLWLQMQGRGSRPCFAIIKTHFIVLDFGMNHERLGLWNQPRKWSIKGPKKQKREQAAPVRQCPNCSAMLYASARSCQYCGHELPKLEYILREGVMCEVDTDLPLGLRNKRVSELSIKEMISCQKTGRLRTLYVWRVLRTLEKREDEKPPSERKAFLGPYCQEIGYKYGWLMSQRSKLDDEKEIGFKDFVLQ